MAEDHPSQTDLSTSAQLSRMLNRASGTHVSVEWLMAGLGRRSFGLTLLVMAALGLVPGASTFIGLLVAWPAIQMALGHDRTVLPRFVARRRISVDRLERVVRVVAPRLAWLERAIRPRWPLPFQAARRLTAILVLLLGLTMAAPLPFTHVLPALAIMLLAAAYLEEDGVALLVAWTVALASLAITAAAIWGTVETIDWLDPVTAG
ncbi:MAG: exopolysaccharide biosynthesis protein [Reyranella sp.]|nr:exopolysaccharide biosynthesis protein [Reyranella sp.]